MPAPTSFFLYKLGKEIKSTYIQEVMIELKSLKLGNAIQSTTLHLRSRGVKKKKKNSVNFLQVRKACKIGLYWSNSQHGHRECVYRNLLECDGCTTQWRHNSWSQPQPPCLRFAHSPLCILWNWTPTDFDQFEILDVIIYRRVVWARG